MTAVASKKTAYMLLFVSVGLVALTTGHGQNQTINMPYTGIPVSIHYLWVFWAFLFIPFINEIRVSNIRPVNILKKEFNSHLYAWSRKLKNEQQPDLFTPLVAVSHKGMFATVWEIKYHQAGLNSEPSHVIVSNPTNTIRLLFVAIFKTFFSLELLDRITLPILVSVLAVLAKVFEIIKGSGLTS